MKLNLGCGRDIRPGWVNVDAVAGPGVDHAFDLGHGAWPLPSDVATELVASHVLEHVPDSLAFMAEAWRVACNGARMEVRVPHGASDDAWEDPTHVRPYFPGSFHAFGQPYYTRADYGYRGDWNLELVKLILHPQYAKASAADAYAATKLVRNAVLEMQATLVAVKPARAQEADLWGPHAMIEVYAMGPGGKASLLGRVG